MRRNEYLAVLYLQLLADGGADGAGGAEMGVGQTPAGITGVDYSAITYGRMDDVQTPAAQDNGAAAAPDLDAEFRELTKGKYKDQYGKAVKEAVDKRFRGKQAALDAYAKQSPLIDMLASRYGREATDIDGIIQAFQDDNALYEQEAMEKGLDTETLKAMKRVEYENAALHRQMEERKQQEGSQRIYAQWVEAGNALQQIYPNFNLQEELTNENFSGLLMAGVDMKTAFEVVHHDEIMPAAMQFAAKTTEEKLAKSIEAGRNRPRENGISSQAAALHRADPSKLSFADIDEINRRIARGDRIKF